MSDPLQQSANQVSVPVHTLPSVCWEPDLFLDGDRFMAYVNENYDSVDVATYSFTVDSVAPLRNVRRLIHGLRFNSHTIKPQKHKYVMNNHVKLFICYKNFLVVDIFVGSQNLTHGTNLNLMYRVRQEHHKPLVDFYDRLWK